MAGMQRKPRALGSADLIRSNPSAFLACCMGRYISFRHILVDGGAITQVRVTVASAPGGLHQKALRGPHLIAPRARRLDFVRRAEPHHEPAACARLAAGKA